MFLQSTDGAICAHTETRRFRFVWLGDIARLLCFLHSTAMHAFVASTAGIQTSIGWHTTNLCTCRRAATRSIVRACAQPVDQEAPAREAVTEEHALKKGITDGAALGSDEFKHHLTSTLGWVGVASSLIPVLYFLRGPDRALEYVTAYIVEYSLSVDNLFVFLLIFAFFKVPSSAQARVLTYGILGAMAMRGVMIVAGEALIQRFEFVTVGFALLLLFSAAKLLLGGDDEDEDLENNNIVKFSRSLLRLSDHFDGDNFFTMKNGIRYATPLMLVLLCVEFSDVVFALDSVPAVLGISNDSFVIYLSNILAIQGLRNLYFILSDAIGDLRFLRQALAIVLGFVGAKMISGVAGHPVPIVPSLSVVVGTLASGVGLSIAFPKADA